MGSSSRPTIEFTRQESQGIIKWTDNQCENTNEDRLKSWFVFRTTLLMGFLESVI